MGPRGARTRGQARKEEELSLVTLAQIVKDMKERMGRIAERIVHLETRGASKLGAAEPEVVAAAAPLQNASTPGSGSLGVQGDLVVHVRKKEHKSDGRKQEETEGEKAEKRAEFGDLKEMLEKEDSSEKSEEFLVAELSVKSEGLEGSERHKNEDAEVDESVTVEFQSQLDDDDERRNEGIEVEEPGKAAELDCSGKESEKALVPKLNGGANVLKRAKKRKAKADIGHVAEKSKIDEPVTVMCGSVLLEATGEASGKFAEEKSVRKWGTRIDSADQGDAGKVLVARNHDYRSSASTFEEGRPMRTRERNISDNSHSLFVESLSCEDSVGTVRSRLKTIPGARSIRILSDRNMREDFGYVVFESSDSVKDAVENKQRVECRDRKLFLDYASHFKSDFPQSKGRGALFQMLYMETVSGGTRGWTAATGWSGKLTF